jgi:hypothetical protein
MADILSPERVVYALNEKISNVNDVILFKSSVKPNANSGTNFILTGG